MDGIMIEPISSSEGAWVDALLEGGQRQQSEESLVPGLRFLEVPMQELRPNPRQPRQVFDEDALGELVHSLKEIGLLQPIVVRPVQDPEQPAIKYELVAGERRLRAATLAGWDAIPAIVRETAEDALLRDALLENLHRAQLNALEEAAAYQQLLEDFGCTQDELAARIGRSRPQISNTLRLMKLPPNVQRRVAAGVLSAGHARALLGLETQEHMEDLAARIVAEGLSVRSVEEIVALGDGRKGRTPRPRRQSKMSESLAHKAEFLADTFDTRVQIQAGKNKGRIIIEFGGIDDLDRIINIVTRETPTEH